MEGICQKIGQVADDLKKDVSSLSFANPDENTPPRLLKAGLAARDAVVNQMESLMPKLEPPCNLQDEALVEYHTSIIKHLGITVTKFGRSQRYVAALFLDESKKINSDLNNLSHCLADLGESIKKMQGENSGLEDIRDLLPRIREERSRVDALKAELRCGEEKLRGLQSREKELNADLETFESSSQGQKLKVLKASLDSRIIEQKEIELEIDVLISPLAKPLARVVQDSSDRLGLQYRRELVLLYRSRYQALEEELSAPLRELQSRFEALGLKDKKKEKATAHIDMLMESKSLEALKARRSEALAKIKKLKWEISENSAESSRLQLDLEVAGNQTRSLEAALARLRSDLSMAEESCARDWEELKSCLEKVAGSKLEIEPPTGE